MHLILFYLTGSGGKGTTTITSPKKGLTATTLTSKTTGTSKPITPIIHLPSGTTGIDEKDEESVSAIQSFINATSDKNAKIQLGDDLKVPKGVQITSAGKGVVNIRAVAESSSKTSAGVTSPNIVATGRGIAAGRGRGAQGGRGRGYTSAAAAAAAVALPKVADIPKGSVKTVTLTAGGIIKRVVPAGRVPGSSVATVLTSVSASPPKKKVATEESNKDEDLDQETLKELEEAMKEQDQDNKKGKPIANKTPTQNGSKTNSISPIGRGRRGGVSKGSPAKSISSPTRQEKDMNSDSTVKEGPRIIRLKSNSAAEVLKSAAAKSGNAELSKEDISNKRKSTPVTPTNDVSSSESPVGSADSRSKRQRREKKIFDL